MESIDAWQFATVVIASYFGLGVFQFPRELIDFSGRDALWSLVLLSGAYFGLLKLYMYLAEQTTNQPVGPVLSHLFNQPCAVPLRLARALIHVLLAVAALANFGQVMRTFFLPGTPIWAVEGAMVLSALYLAWFGTAVLARTIETIFMPSLVGSVLIGVLVVHELQFTWALMPSTHFYLDPIFLGALHSSYIYFSFDTIIALYTAVRPERRKTARKYVTRMYLATVGVFLFGMVIVVGMEGPSAVSLMQWPAVSALRLANVRGFFLTKLGLLVVILWGLFTLAFIGVRLWHMAYDLSFQSRQHIVVGRYHFIVLAASIVIFLGAQAFSNVVVLVHVFQTWGILVVTLYLVLLPIILLLALAWQRRRGQVSSPVTSDS